MTACVAEYRVLPTGLRRHGDGFAGVQLLAAEFPIGTLIFTQVARASRTAAPSRRLKDAL